MNPVFHAESAAKIWGGVPEDYLPIHSLLDTSKEAYADNRHRALTHNNWFCNKIIPMIFGEILTNSAGRRIPTKDIAYQHCIEDFHGFVPTAADYLNEMSPMAWMNNSMRGMAPPPSRAKYRINRAEGSIEGDIGPIVKPSEVLD